MYLIDSLEANTKLIKSGHNVDITTLVQTYNQKEKPSNYL